MSRVYKKGDTSIDSADLNRFGAMADRVLSNAPATIVRAANTSPAQILVKNDSGFDVDQFNALELGDAAITYADNYSEFKARVFLTGTRPNFFAGQDTSFCITLEPIKNGKIGRCVATGLVQCQVEMKETWHKYVDFADDSSANLISAPASRHRLVWVASTTGTQWALVFLNGAEPVQTYARLTAAGASSRFHEGEEYVRRGNGAILRNQDPDTFANIAFTSSDRGEIRTETIKYPYGRDRYYPVVWSRGVTGDNDGYVATCVTNIETELCKVVLSSTGGAAGDAATQCSYTYEAQDDSGNTILSGIDPSAGTYTDYLRPPVGKMIAATRGYGYFTSSSFVLSGCNERLDLQAQTVVTDSDPSETKTTIATPGTA